MRVEVEPRVLVIQPRRDQYKIAREQENLHIIAKLVGVELIFVNPLLEDHHPWHNPPEILEGIAGTLWLGSSDFDLSKETEDKETYLQRVAKLAEEVLARDIPTIAVCMGHQTLHLIAGGAVERVPESMEEGTTIIELNALGEKEKLLEGVITNKNGYPGVELLVGHKDSVTKLGKGFRRLGSTRDKNGNPRDENALTRRGNILTIQGHPEIENPEHLKSVVTELTLALEKILGAYQKTDEFTRPVLPPTGILKNFMEDLPHDEHLSRRQAA
jgi:GMP synthase-like glutamine amidotransferase